MARQKVRIFNQLQESLQDARSFERGAPVDLRVAEIPRPPERITPRKIKAIRCSLNASQPLFALLLNVSPKAVQSWEQGLRRPRAAALKLLAIAKKNPEVLLKA
ncbi:MAG: helix-turn-helix domain-containing protein [Terriglobia bacterium]